MASRTRPLTPGELAELEEQRDFLLGSLEDLEAEHEAGDVDEGDYDALRDDYTTRAAAVLRALEAGKVRERRRAARPGVRVVATLVGVALFAVGAGLLVAQSAGERGSGETITGEIRQTTRGRLDQASSLTAGGRYQEALEIYDDVLGEYPGHAEALTYRGWTLTLSGELLAGVESLTEATEVAPEFPDARALLAVTFYRAGRTDPAVQGLFFDQARTQLEALEELDLAGREEIEQLLTPVRAELEAADEVSD
jgi:tetratricopeptide (TPR) repeat protein